MNLRNSYHLDNKAISYLLYHLGRIGFDLLCYWLFLIHAVLLDFPDPQWTQAPKISKICINLWAFHSSSISIYSFIHNNVSSSWCLSFSISSSFLLWRFFKSTQTFRSLKYSTKDWGFIWNIVRYFELVLKLRSHYNLRFIFDFILFFFLSDCFHHQRFELNRQESI